MGHTRTRAHVLLQVAVTELGTKLAAAAPAVAEAVSAAHNARVAADEAHTAVKVVSDKIRETERRLASFTAEAKEAKDAHDDVMAEVRGCCVHPSDISIISCCTIVTCLQLLPNYHPNPCDAAGRGAI
jgi:hypothetical protein